MRSGLLSADDELLAHLDAPPDLRQGVESLAYWRERRKRLPWYRLALRREAARLAVAWEKRVAAALIRQRGVPLTPRLQGVRLVASARLRRFGRRVALVLAAATAAALLVAPLAVLAGLVLRII